MNRAPSPRFTLLAVLLVVSAAFLAGCGSDPTTSAQFTASRTAPAPGVIKLEQKSRSGSRVVVAVRIYGPEPALDLFAFRFGIRIGDARLVRLATQTTYPQDALVAANGQTIAIDVDASDPTLIEVNVEKQGGGVGNGFATASASVIELPFDVEGEGGTSLTLVGLANDPPKAFDSTHAVIAGVSFDAASAGVRGVTTGGGRY